MAPSILPSLKNIIVNHSRFRSHITTNKMTKCIGSVTSWLPKILELEDPTFIVDDVKEGERSLAQRLSNLLNSIHHIISDYFIIKRSACKAEKSNCSHLQESLTTRLENLHSEIISVIHSICSSNLSTLTKHRYFMVFSSGAIDKLTQLLRAAGRLSELDHELYLEEQRKPLVSEESITIHSLTAIWSATLTIMNSFYEPASKLFKDQAEESDDYNFIDQLEFSTMGPYYAKVFLTDLIITSWLQFNRLVRYDDLVHGIPFLCPCHGRLYTSILKTASKSGEDKELLPRLLNLILDQDDGAELMSRNLRQLEIVPYQKFYADFPKSSVAYFVVWHLCSLARLVGDANKDLISSCQLIFQESFAIALDQFLPAPSQRSSTSLRLSPHQEERFKLLFLMINRWSEKQSDNLSLIKQLFSFFDKHWDLFGDKYFDRATFRVDGLTLFQLCTKLLNEAMPLYTKDGQATSNLDKVPTREEQELTEIWDRLLSRVRPATQQQQT